jgi:hypothetical protein
MSGNNRKYQEIQDQKHEILGNTLVFLHDSCSTWVFLLTGSWTALFFLLGYMKFQTGNSMKYKEILSQNHAISHQEILENSRKYLEISGNILKYQEIPRQIMKY